MVAQNNFQNFYNSIKNSNLTIIKELIDSGYDINIPIEDGSTPLILAASLGKLDIVKLLVESGANVNEIDFDGTTPLICAANQGFLDIFNYLVPLTNSEIKGISLLISVCDGELEIIKSLIATGIDVDAYREKGVWTENGRTPLIISIYEEYLEIVKALIEAGANPNLIDEDTKNTPLICAVRVKNINIIRLLLQANVDVNAKNSEGKIALSLAKELGNTEIINLLIEIGAKENI